MKTLDEVIKAFDICIYGDIELGCQDCKYRNMERGKNCKCERNVDALHYLKEYRAVANDEDNPPLTWAELKQMKGKPVWVVEKGYETWEYWSLVYWMKDDELTLWNENGQTTYSKNEQGTVWQAYRKERG